MNNFLNFIIRLKIIPEIFQSYFKEEILLFL